MFTNQYFSSVTTADVKQCIKFTRNKGINNVTCEQVTSGGLWLRKADTCTCVIFFERHCLKLIIDWGKAIFLGSLKVEFKGEFHSIQQLPYMWPMTVQAAFTVERN